jgi:hypothetical protein
VKLLCILLFESEGFLRPGGGLCFKSGGQRREGCLIRAVCVALFVCAALRPVLAAEPLKVPIGYLARSQTVETTSLLEQPAANNGSAGGQLAVQDNNTTGRFLNQSFSLEAMRIAAHGAIGQKTPIMLLYTMAQPAWHREQGGKT